METINFKIRLTTKEDYIELCDWWNWWPGWNPPPISLLDDLKFGIIISLNGENICAGFIYFTNARAFGLLEYIVSTYKVRDKQIRKDAIELLIASLMSIAKKKGVDTLFSSVRSENLINHYKNCGWVVGSTNTTEMIVKL